MDLNKIVERIKAILLTPKPTWEAIKTEPGSVGQIYTQYLVPLAVVPAVARFIGFSLIGVSFAAFGGRVRTPIVSGLVGAVLGYVLTLVGIFIAAKVINALAPTFGAAKNDLGAFKVAAYSWTPALVAGVLSILPPLAPLGLLAALYGIYLLYLGLIAVMACPPDKAVGYTAVSVVAMIIIFAVIGLLSGLAMGAGRSAGAMFSSRPSLSGPAEVVVTTEQGPAHIQAGAGGNDVTVKTKDGTTTYSAGSSAKIPANFPKDVYVYEGASVVAAVSVPGGWQLQLQTRDPIGSVADRYRNRLNSAAWTLVNDVNQAAMTMLMFRNAKYNLQVVLTQQKGATLIHLGVSPKT